MQINELFNFDEVSTIVISELKEIGIKHRRDKKHKQAQQTKKCCKRVFRIHLHLLELTDVILANGSVVQIPKFVADACNRILEQVETEGIFRKAGSNLRQKEIRLSLETGLPLGKTHHVIDVANVIKFFFRELPEPLIPPSIQDTFLRSLVVAGDNQIRAILLSCLLLPPLSVNTMSFFMQFLRTVSLNAHLNKMTAANLAIVFTPGLMPYANITTHRFSNHLKVVQLLIENANFIGCIPDTIMQRLHINNIPAASTIPTSFQTTDATQKKKKKRRSGSLSQMFNGLKKIVGSALGSSENLDDTRETKSPPVIVDKIQTKTPIQAQATQQPATPRIRTTTKKRKFGDPISSFSAKKRKDLLALLPSNSGGLLPNTPMTKEHKKSRLSLGGNRNMKTMSVDPVVKSMERRWSIIGNGWSKAKHRDGDGKKIFPRYGSNLSTEEIVEVSPHKSDVPAEGIDCERITSDTSSIEHSSMTSTEFVCIPKSEYNDIEKRVANLENCISQEFGVLSKSLSHERSVASVQTKYDEMIVGTENLTSKETDLLAQRLSRNLRIRRSIDQHIVRSPSARKIGTIRRRSQDKKLLSRNPTFHHTINRESTHCESSLPSTLQPSYFYAKSNLKRGRPNTLHTGLATQTHSSMSNNLFRTKQENIEQNIPKEEWTSGDVFFMDPPHTNINHGANIFDAKGDRTQCMKITECAENVNFTPAKNGNYCADSDNMHTPMLPPKRLPRKSMYTKTPSSAQKTTSARKETPLFMNPITLAHPAINEELNGRESIARLRAQNAGMVMAKAKLFDGMGGSCMNQDEFQPNRNHVKRRKSYQLMLTADTPKSQASKQSITSSKENTEMHEVAVILPNSLDSKNVNTKKSTVKSTEFTKKQQRSQLSLNSKYPYKVTPDLLSSKEVALHTHSRTNDRLSIQNSQNVKFANKLSPKTRRFCKNRNVKSSTANHN